VIFSRIQNLRSNATSSLCVLHLPANVGGNPQGLSRHLGLLGVDSRSLSVQQNSFGHAADRVLESPGSSRLFVELKRLLALGYIFRHDVVFFNFGTTLFGPVVGPHSGYVLGRIIHTVIQRIELLLLSMRRVVLLVQYQGDDARQGAYCRENFALSPAGAVGPQYYNSRSDALKRRQIQLMDRYCSRIYALNPDLLHVLPARAEFLPYGHISLDEWIPRYNQGEERPLRLGHAPTHRGVKGTVHVLAAADELRRKGHEFELVLIEGLNNQDAKAIYEQVDVLVDQLYVGWYGALAVELMALGKPVVAYIRDGDLNRIPADMRADLPIVRADPASLVDVLESLLLWPRSDLLAIGRRSREYVERWHDPIAIAQRIKTDIESELANRHRPRNGRRSDEVRQR
jgi:hypothetical protein